MPVAFNFPPDYATKPYPIGGTKLLDGRFYGFRFSPNLRADQGRGRYFVDVFDALNNPVIYGVMLRLSTDLFGRFRATVQSIPPGRVVVRRTDGVEADPAIYDLAVPDEPRRLQTLGSPAVVVEYVTLVEIALESGSAG